MSKSCSYCGTENPNEAKFCRKCGQQSFNDSIVEDNFKINEDDFYEQAWIEVENNTQVKKLWAKAFAKAEGNKEKTKAIYLQVRVEQLKKETKEKETKQAERAKEASNKDYPQVKQSFFNENETINLLVKKGYKVQKTYNGWKIKEPLGGIKIIKEEEEFDMYAKSREYH